MDTQKKHHYKKICYYILAIALAFWWLPASLFHQNTHDHKEEKVIEHLLDHVEDKYMLHFGDVHIPLPVILYKKGSGFKLFSSKHLFDHHGHPKSHQGFQLKKGKIQDIQNHKQVYDFSITKNVVWMWLSLLLILAIFGSCALYLKRRKNRHAEGFWVLPLVLVRFVRNDILKKNIDPKKYQRFAPYFLTLFSYILINNILGLLPEGPNITGNLSITLTLSSITFLMTQWHASSNHWKHIFLPPDIPIIMYPIIVPLEIISLLLKPIILAMRLFLNILIGHILILCFIGMIFILKLIFAATLVMPLVASMILLKMIVAYIQAYVFTLIATISLGQATATTQEH